MKRKIVALRIMTFVMELATVAIWVMSLIVAGYIQWPGYPVLLTVLATTVVAACAVVAACVTLRLMHKLDAAEEDYRRVPVRKIRRR